MPRYLKITVMTSILALGSALSLLAAMAGPASAAPQSPAPKAAVKLQWGTPAGTALPPLADNWFSGTPAPDGSAYTLLFTGLSAQLDGATAERLVSVRVPVTPGPAGRLPTGFRTDVRASIRKDPDARVIVLLDLGGATRTLQYDYGTTLTGHDATITLSSAGTKPRPAYTARVVLLLERRTASATAAVTVDSLDVVPLPPASPRHPGNK